MTSRATVPVTSDHLRWLGGILGLYALADPPDPDHLSGMLPALELLSVPEGEAIIREGERGAGLFILYSGALEVERGGRRIADLQSGVLLGEMGFLMGTPRTATVIAARACEVFHIPDIGGFLGKYPGLRSFLEETAQRRLGELSRLSDFQRGGTMPALGDGPRGAACLLPKRMLAGRYEVGDLLGEGGMGRVYRAFDKSLERPVAVKQLHGGASAAPKQRERFMREARTVARLAHPYIVGVHDIVDEGGELFLVMEFVDGHPLSKPLERGKRYSLRESQDVFGFICQAVACAHWNHVLHRDLKPANIMVDRMGFAKVMDFGLAFATGFQKKEISGTPTHMAPEQHWGESGIASDVYSLGVCLYEMLTGALPFAGPDFAAQKKAGVFPAPSALAPALKGTGIDAVVAAALAPAPDRRPSGPLQLFEALKRVKAP